MLRYFRINDPYRLVGLLILLLLIYLPLFIDFPGITLPELKSMVLGEKLNENQKMYLGVVDSSGPLAAWLFESADSFFGRSVPARHIVAFVLIFLQGAYVGIMFITRKVFNENTYIPSFLFCVLFFFSFDTLALSGELAGSTFLLLALNNLFKEIEFRVQRDETIFNLGLYISFASLFAFAFYVYLFCAMAILFFFTRTSLRKFILLIFGFLLPHLLVVSLAYLSHSLPKVWEYYYLWNLGFSRETFISIKGLLVLSVFPILYFVIAVVMLQRESRFSKYQSQLLQIMFLWIGFSFLYLFVCKALRPQNLIVFIPAFSFLFTHFFLFIRRKKFVEMNFWILLLGIITMGYLARYNKLGAVNYNTLLVREPKNQAMVNKRIMVLENDVTWFLRNKLSSPYLNWRLSQNVFRNPDYYENVTEVYHTMKNDPPEAIVDPENLFKPFLDRMPEFEKQYNREGIFYKKKSNR